MVNRITPTPKCSHPKPPNIQVCYWHGKGKVRLQITLWLLISWPGDEENLLDCPRGSNVITRVRVREMFEDDVLLSLRMKEAKNQGLWQPLEAGKGTKQKSPRLILLWGLQKDVLPSQFGLMRLIVDIGPPNYQLTITCCFKLLNLWYFYRRKRKLTEIGTLIVPILQTEKPRHREFK